MNERLLQFIWQFQYFNKSGLFSVQGEPLTIIHPGYLNTNQGPDFQEAKIKLAETTWIGNLEIHLQASHWKLHKHAEDTNYNNIILHVVWQNDLEITDYNGQPIPALELEGRISGMLLDKYEQMMHAKGFVPCENYLPALSEVSWLAWKERLAVERLQRKAEMITTVLEQSNKHWEEVFWWMLARNFGMKVNAASFELMGMSIPVNILAKHKNQINQLEALLMGQAGLLGEHLTDDYGLLLKREYTFLAKKYKLKPISKTPDFLRMRPANFPTVRLAQLAMLVHRSSHLFSEILAVKDLNYLKDLLNVTANDYWHYHYTFNEETAYKPKTTGGLMTENIIINTVVPVLFAYGLHQNTQSWKDKALQYLSQLRPEQNAITKQWKQRNVQNENALDSQSLLELKHNYCDKLRCLSCAVGNKVLRPA